MQSQHGRYAQLLECLSATSAFVTALALPAALTTATLALATATLALTAVTDATTGFIATAAHTIPTNSIAAPTSPASHTFHANAVDITFSTFAVATTIVTVTASAIAIPASAAAPTITITATLANAAARFPSTASSAARGLWLSTASDHRRCVPTYLQSRQSRSDRQLLVARPLTPHLQLVWRPGGRDARPLYVHGTPHDCIPMQSQHGRNAQLLGELAAAAAFVTALASPAALTTATLALALATLALAALEAVALPSATSLTSARPAVACASTPKPTSSSRAWIPRAS